eukprot:s2323_g4.t1
MNLRIKGVLPGDGGGYDCEKLFYLSIHTLDSQQGIQYAKSRVAREILDAWLAKKISFDGKKYDDSEELASISGAQYIKSIDKLPLQVCVRKGNQICIHPDQVKQWNNSGLEISEAFAQLKEEHDSKYMNMLASLITEPDAVVAAAPGAEEAAVTVGKEDDPIDLGADSFESLEKLQEVDPVLHRCQSEISGIELLKFIPAASNEEGVEFAWPQGDQTIVQVDHSSIAPDNTHVEAMNLYRYLIMLEKVKKITEYKLSYTDCVRANRDSAAGAGGDSFKVTINDEQKYKRLTKDAATAKSLTCKSFFSTSLPEVKQSKSVFNVFRWRFERAHGVSKIQKPYVLTCAALNLEAKKPARIC